MTTFSTFATATYATGNIVVVQSAENMIPGLPITFMGNTFGNVTANATYYIGNIAFGYPTSNITLTSLPGGAIYAIGNGSGSMVASFTQGGQQIIPTVPPGEPLNQAFDAINVNFDQIFAAGPVGSNIQIDENTIYTLNTNGNLVLNPNGIGNVVANAHVVPDQDRVRNLGAPVLRWNTIYAQNIVGNIAGNIVAGGSNGQIQFNNNGILAGANGFTYNNSTNAVGLVGTITAGNVLTPGIVSSAGGVYGDIYTTMIDSGDSSAILVLSEVNMLSDLTVGQSLQVDNNISADGNITGGNLLFGAGVISGTGNIYADKIFANIQGNVDAAGNLNEVQFNTTGDQLGASANFTYDSANNILTVSSGNIVGGNIIGGNIFSTGSVSATGNITANYYFGNGSQLTGITADNVNADDLIGNTLSGNVLYSNLITVGNLVSLSVVGNTTTGNLDTAGAVSATGNVTAGNVLFGSGVVSGTGNIYANKIFANIQGNVDAAGNLYEIQFNTTGDQLGANANFTYDFANNVFTVANGNVVGGNILTSGNVSATGNVHGNWFIGNVDAQTVSASGNITGGNVLTGGIVSASGNITGGNLITAGYVTATGDVTGGNILTSGFISATSNIISAANITGGNLLTGGQVSATGTGTFGNVLTGGIVSATSTIQGGNIVTAGDVTATGSVTGGNIYTGGVVSAVSTVTGGNLATAGTVTATGTITGGNVITGGIVSAAGDVTGGNLSTAGNVTGANVVATNGFFGNINLTGGITVNSLTSNTFISATGTGTFGNIATVGTVSATGNVTGNYFIGNGAFLTGIDTTLISNGNTNVQTYANGNVSVTVAGVANTVVFTVTGVDVAGNVSASGNVTGGNIATAGAVSAAGNVSGANVNTTTVWSNSDLNLQPVGNVALGNRYVTGVRYPSADQDAASKIYVDNLVSTAISYHEAVTAATTTDLATATGGTITYNQPGGAGNGIGATLTTTGSFNLIDTANVQTAGTRILVKNEANATHNGVYVWSNATVITRSSDADTAGVGNAFALGLNDYFFVTNGNVNLGSAWIVDAPTSAIVFGTSNIEFAQFSQSQVYSANTSAGLSLTGTVFSAKVDNNTTAFDGGGNISVKAGANLTTPNIGAATGTSLSTTGNVEGGNIVTVGYVTATGNVTGGNIVTSGNITATGNVAGNYFIGNGSQLTGVTAASMDAGNLTGNTLSSNVLFSSLTTVGTLTSLSVSGNVDGGNIHTAGTVSATGTVVGGNVATAGSVSATGNVTGGNILTAGYVTATGTGTFGNVLTGGIVSATSSLLGGNVLTPGDVSAGGSLTGGNIFTGGVVSAVSTVTGGNIATTGYVTATGNITGGNIISAGQISSTGNITAPTFVGNLEATIVSASGNVTGGNILFGSGIVSGTGNIYANKIFANISGNIDAAGNINEIQFNGTGDILTASAGFTFDPTGNTLTANGNISGANLFTGGLVSATSTITGGNILTGGIVSATGNITGNNVIVGNILIPSSGNVTLGNVNINNLANPVANSDAATKFYVDSVAANVLPIISNQTIDPDGTSNTFVLNQTATDVGILLTINGITQTPTTNYTVTGNSLTMNETPLSSDIIQVRYLSGTQIGGSGSNYANANVVAYGQSGWAGNIIPAGNLVYNLGNSTNRWNDLYLSGNTIYLDAATIGATGPDVTFSGNVTGGNLVSSGSIIGNPDIILGNTANAAATRTRIVTDTTFSYIQTGNGTPNSTGNIVFSPYSSPTQRVVIDTASGNLSATGNITAANFVGNGATLAHVATKFSSTISVPVGNSTQSFTVDAGHTYQLWLDCNIPNGILVWNATATITNTNVPVVGDQYAWVYSGGGTPIDFTSIPNQFVGTANTIVRSSVAPSSTTNRFDFGINNTSGNSQTIRYGWVRIS